MIDRLRGMDRTQWLGGVALAAIALAAVPVWTMATATAAPRDFGILSGDPADLDDGFHHFVVALNGTPTAEVTAAAHRDAGDPPEPPPPTPAPASTTRAEVPVPQENGQVSPQALDALRGQGRIVEVARRAGGQLVAVVEGGIAPLAEGTRPATGAAGDGPAALLAVPGTQRVEAVAPGVYQVTTSADPDAYRSLPGVATVERDTIATIFTNDPQYPTQWHLENTGQTVGGLRGTSGVDLGVDDAWKVASGSGRVVAVIDTGMDVDHPDLAGSIWQNPGEVCANNADDDGNGRVDDCRGWDFVHNDGRVQSGGAGEVDNHATHIAGMISARTGNGVGVAGIAPGARVMPLKVGDGGSFWMSTAAAALRYAVDEGADIVNCSFGGDGADATFRAALDYANAHGVLVVAAAGNSSRDIDAAPTYPASFPHPNLLTVAASTSQDTPASFSNWGRTSVDLYAAGQYIHSTVPVSAGAYGLMSGTSMASPAVAAAAAVVWSAHPELDATGVKSQLMQRSPAFSESGRPTVAGRRLDLGAVVNPGGSGVGFTVDGLAGARPDTALTLSVRASVPAAAVPAGDRVRYRARVFTQSGGQVYGVVGLPVTTGTGSSATDDEAAVDLGEGPGDGTAMALPLTLGLPAGQYALVTEASAAGAGTIIGQPGAVYFGLSADAPAPPPTSGPTPTTGAPAPAPTTRPAVPTTRAPGAGPAPTTKPPAGPTTTRWSGGPTPTAPRPTWTPTTKPSGPAPTSPGPGTPTTVRPGTPPPVAGPAPTTPAPAPAPGPGATRPPVAPTTTRPPTTGPPVTSPPLPPAPPPVTANGLTIRSVSPRYGSTAGGERLEISGAGFSGYLYVKVGGIPVTGSVLSPSLIAVTTPAHTAGAVDIEVGRLGGGAVIYRQGYEYRAPDPGTGTVPAPGRPVTPPPTGGGGGSNPGPTPTPTTKPPATTPTTTSPPGGGTTPAPTGPGFTFGPERAVGGLRLRPVTGGPALAPVDTWAARSCGQPSCGAESLPA